MNLYGYNPEISTNFIDHPISNTNNHDPYSYCNEFGDFSGLQHPSHNPVIDPIEVPEIPDTCFNYISNLLRDNYSDDTRTGATLQDYMTAQISYNKSLDAALIGETSSLLFSANNHNHLQNHCLDDYLSIFSSNLSSINNNVASENAVYDDLMYQNTLNVNDTVGFGDNVVNDNFSYQNTLIGNGSTRNVSCENAVNNDSSVYQNTLFGNVSTSNVGEVPGNLLSGEELLNQYEDALRFIDENWQIDQPVSTSSSGREENRESHRLDSLPEVQRGVNYVQQNVNLFSNTLMQDPISQIGPMASNCADFNEHQEVVQGEFLRSYNTGDKARGRKHDGANDEDEEGGENGRNGKQSAPSNEWSEQIEKYGDVLLCPEGRSKPAALCSSSRSKSTDDQNEKNGGAKTSKGTRKRGSKAQVVDLRALLTRCAQCVARVDLIGAYDMLKQIRQHATPCGDFLQRVAYYLANGLEARLEGKGSEISRANEEIPPCDVLKANRVFVASVPFKIMSYYTTNKTIASLVEVADSIHIIDFGIYYGLQWPCIIQNLSKRPNGPPKLRITGIDFPQRGFRPAERVEETGRCLAMYCEKYNVPFEYNGIAQPWETIKVEDLKIERNEPLVVNCLYRSHNLFDESIDETSPRNEFLKLVRKIKPDLFMHGIVNSTASVPFFLNRFKEVMFHYSALFDIFESTMSREDDERMLLESKLYANQALNVIACEGTERVERPETYKQWQIRTQRAGFEQVQIDRELVRRARAMVKRSFREEFSYDEDGLWVVQGWKGRILYAISCWKPTE